AMAWMMDHGALPAGSNLRGVLGEQRYGRVSAAAAGLGLPMAALDSLAPWVVGIEIADLAYEHEGYDPEQGVEEQLVRRATKDGKPTAGRGTMPQEASRPPQLPSGGQESLPDQPIHELQDIQTHNPP